MPTRARLYSSLRSAHLERARQLPAATILYQERRYDFDPSLAAGLDLVDGRGLRAARALVRRPPDVLEVNEPLMLESALWTAATVAVIRVVQAGRRRKTRLVTYAIENRHPWLGAPQARRWRTRARRALERLAARFLWRRLDRVAFGTAQARELYEWALAASKAEKTLLWALPRPADAPAVREPMVLFTSAFQLRKGIDTLLEAWPAVRDAVPGTRLVLVGTGAERGHVEAAAAADDTITVVVDPPRAEIHALQAACRVLVLPSRRTATWREQVGLPIVEALSHGCTIVTTTETGLADWLATHGHVVVPPGDPAALAVGIRRALSEPLPVTEVLASLPAEDGRLAADRWMFADDGT